MPEIAIIFTGLVMLAIVIGISLNGIVAKVLDYKREKRGLVTSPAPQPLESSARTDLIEDRLRVLERLATDRGAMLADEIEALRSHTLDARREREGA